jgi:hypothetical protein
MEYYYVLLLIFLQKRTKVKGGFPCCRIWRMLSTWDFGWEQWERPRHSQLLLLWCPMNQKLDCFKAVWNCGKGGGRWFDVAFLISPKHSPWGFQMRMKNEIYIIISLHAIANFFTTKKKVDIVVIAMIQTNSRFNKNCIQLTFAIYETSNSNSSFDL